MRALQTSAEGVFPEALVGPAWSLVGLVVIIAIGWIGSILVKRTREPTTIRDSLEMLDKMYKEIYGDEETDSPGLKVIVATAQRQNAAKSRIIKDLILHIQEHSPGTTPKLDPRDIRELEEGLMAPEWVFEQHNKYKP